MAIDRGKLKNDIRNYFDRIIELAKEDSPDIVLILESAMDSVMKIIRNQTPVTAGCKPRPAETPELIKLEDALAICSAYCPDDDGTCSKAGHDLREMLDDLECLPTIHVPDVLKLRWIKAPGVRPIDANALERDTEWDDRYDGFLSYSQSQIDAAPTLDYPVRYAEWDGDHRCTNCGISLRDLVAEDSELDTDIILYGTPFCPNCGADMTHGKQKE